LYDYTEVKHKHLLITRALHYKNIIKISQ